MLYIFPIPSNTFAIWNSSEWEHYHAVVWLLLANLKGYGKAYKWTVSFPQSKLLSFWQSFTNPRNIISCVGTNADFPDRIVNPSSRKGATVALIFLKRVSKVSPSYSESSIYFTGKCPFVPFIFKWKSQNFCKDPFNWWKSIGKDNILTVSYTDRALVASHISFGWPFLFWNFMDFLLSWNVRVVCLRFELLQTIIPFYSLF